MKCLMCDNEIGEITEEYMMRARQYGKTITLMYSYFRKRCCSEECFEKWIGEVEEYISGVKEHEKQRN